MTLLPEYPYWIFGHEVLDRSLYEEAGFYGSCYDGEIRFQANRPGPDHTDVRPNKKLSHSDRTPLQTKKGYYHAYLSNFFFG